MIFNRQTLGDETWCRTRVTLYGVPVEGVVAFDPVSGWVDYHKADPATVTTRGEREFTASGLPYPVINGCLFAGPDGRPLVFRSYGKVKGAVGE